MKKIYKGFICLLAALFPGPVVFAQSVASDTSAQSHVDQEPGHPSPAEGKVLFSRGSADPAKPAAGFPAQSEVTPQVTDAERGSPEITAYDLDVHLVPATAAISARARMTIRNDGPAALSRLALQISSTLRWESFSVPAGSGSPLSFAQQTIETDLDHTGAVSEAVLALPRPLATGATLELTAVYSGAIARSSARLDRIGAPAEQARLADWDEIAPGQTALRGFGEVLWYPVAAGPVFLGDGARFFEAVGRARFRARPATARLRLSVEYVGEPPHSAYFCGRLEQLTAHPDNGDVPVAEAPGIATAEFAAETLGFRTVSLFITDRPETVDPDGLLTAVTESDAAFQAYSNAAHMVQPMFAEWYGSAGPAQPLRMIDHDGQPFADGALIAAPMRPLEISALAPELAQALSHAWMPTREPWMEEGLAQFSLLLWTERTAGRDAALAQLEHDAVPLALAEPGPEERGVAGQSLLEARDQVFFRTKAAAVWWMLRAIVGDDQLKSAFAHFRLESRSGSRSPSADDTTRLQRILEQGSGGSLAWFFDDWVRADKGLPDLSIVQITPRELPAQAGKRQGWLVAVEVRNEGAAVAEVPVTVRSGTLTATERLRIPGRSTASTRILFEKTPEEAVVNDGSVPEARTSHHSRAITLEPR